jgi:creatinase/prolidase-like protein
MEHTGRRAFLRGAAGVAALTLTSRSSVFGLTHNLSISATLASSGANLPDRLPPDWYRRKILQIQQQMAKANLDAIVLLYAPNVIYATGYFHLSTERPLAAPIPKSGSRAVCVWARVGPGEALVDKRFRGLF